MAKSSPTEPASTVSARAEVPDPPVEVSAAGQAHSNGNGHGRGARGGTKRVGIREIARLSDVSVATVSMVINHSDRISEATRRKVARVMDQVGYRPNRLAQSLSGRYTRIISVLMPTLRHALADPYFGELISGICDRAARLGHKVMLEHAKPDFIRERRHIELFERRYVDGVLCIGFNDKHAFMKDFADRKFPMVAVDNVFPEWGLDHVVSGYEAGADQVMTYLLQLGHRRIGMVHGTLEAYTARLLRDAFLNKTRAAGAPLDDSWLVDGKFTEAGGYEAAGELLRRHPDVTAIFAGNDKMALGVMHHLAQHGLKVPDAVSVIGFDDIQHTAFVNPALTTVHLPLYEVGARACDRLVERIRGKAQSVAEVIPTHLILRESTAMVARNSPN